MVVIDEDHTDDESISAGSAFLARVLQYQETPQYLRKCGLDFIEPGYRAAHSSNAGDSHAEYTQWRSYCALSQAVSDSFRRPAMVWRLQRSSPQAAY